MSSVSRSHPTPTRCAGSRRRRAARFFAAPTEDDLSPVVYDDLESRLGSTDKDEEITFAFAAGSILLLLAGGGLSALWFRRVP